MPAPKIESNFQGKAVVERCGDCRECRATGELRDPLPCSNMLVMLPDGQVESAGSDDGALKKIRAWFSDQANDLKFNFGFIEWRKGTGYSIFKGAKHEPADCRQLMGLHQVFATKSWSDAFECPTCGTRKRYNLNFLGGKKIVCDGRKFTKVER